MADLAAAALSGRVYFVRKLFASWNWRDVLPIHHQVQAGIAADKFKTRGKGGSKGGVHRTLSDLPWVYKALQGWIKHGRPFLLKEALARKKGRRAPFSSPLKSGPICCGWPSQCQRTGHVYQACAGIRSLRPTLLVCEFGMGCWHHVAGDCQCHGEYPASSSIHYQSLLSNG